jgi:tRNA dimethylallyltransferase
LAAIAECREAGRLPVVVGGTGLYLKALMAGIVPVPEIPDSIRRAVRERIAAAGVEAVHAELARRDPASAAAIGTRDVQRIARALEVVEATGRPLSDWRADGWQGAGEGMRFFVVLLAPPRDALYRACDTRFARMIERGGIDEVRALAALGLDPALPAMKALGVREILRHLAGELTLDQARAAGAQATRNYVKRQATWFRHQLAPDITVEALVPPIPDSVLGAVARFLAEGSS